MATDTLVPRVSETVYGVPAQFTVLVDGKQVGATYQTNAIHGWKSDIITIGGDWDAGGHTVQIKYLNDFKDAGGDRNLFLDSATYNGVAVPGASLNMWSAYDPNTFKLTDTTALAATTTEPPPATTTLPPTTPPPAPAEATDTLVLKVSETVYGAAAQFTVSVDGVQVGGTYQTTAMHGWKSDTLTLKGNWDSGDHSVSIKFLSDQKDAGGDRNLFLDGATYNGVAVPNAKLDMWSAYAPHVFKVTDTTPLTATPAPNPPPPVGTALNHDGLTDLNVIIRGQSNAFLLDQQGGDDILKAELQKALPGVRINILDGENKTEFSGTAFTTWDTGGQQQKMYAYLNSLPAEIKDNETITVWMHNETDQGIGGLTTEQWKQEVQVDANNIRDIFDHQGAASTPYLFVPIRYPYGSGFPVIRQGMEEFSADPKFNAKMSWVAYGPNITMTGGPEVGPNSSHIGGPDSATIGHDLAAPILDLYHAIA
jgi:hypothetical protein